MLRYSGSFRASLEKAAYRRILAQVMVGACIALTTRGTARAQTSRVPMWAFPGTSPDLEAARPPYDSVRRLHVPHSSRSFTMAQVTNPFAPPDWHPTSHPRMPAIIARGRPPAVWACGYCHLPDGQGRTENATLAGLPARYIISQVLEFRSRDRRSVVGSWAPSVHMRDVADNVTDGELATAARYFSRMRAKPRFKVVELDSVPDTYEAGGLYALRPGSGMQPIGHRVIEITNDLRRHELRDAAATFRAFVPRGSIATGRRIATAIGGTPVRSCVACHGASLRGVGQVPPIAGRSPSYLLRQLLAFKAGTRAAPTSAPMRAISGTLSLDDMIAVAAYAGSLHP